MLYAQLPPEIHLWCIPTPGSFPAVSLRCYALALLPLNLFSPCRRPDKRLFIIPTSSSLIRAIAYDRQRKPALARNTSSNPDVRLGLFQCLFHSARPLKYCRYETIYTVQKYSTVFLLLSFPPPPPPPDNTRWIIKEEKGRRRKKINAAFCSLYRAVFALLRAPLSHFRLFEAYEICWSTDAKRQ